MNSVQLATNLLRGRRSIKYAKHAEFGFGLHGFIRLRRARRLLILLATGRTGLDFQRLREVGPFGDVLDPFTLSGGRCLHPRDGVGDTIVAAQRITNRMMAPTGGSELAPGVKQWCSGQLVREMAAGTLEMSMKGKTNHLPGQTERPAQAVDRSVPGDDPSAAMVRLGMAWAFVRHTMGYCRTTCWRRRCGRRTSVYSCGSGLAVGALRP